ncbi:uncharacterized protein LOC130767945 isoform X3 [Actinidia eriantha]|uniref:uncharacterized protein LOC130767945 isoform X3 n=1 Tax=Actinidia eriantha TaxID=165200 RepID=UPI002585B3C6|nr:uncharacterized protein LOC130767945 isoform X3 [Actinidia eriantha]
MGYTSTQPTLPLSLSLSIPSMENPVQTPVRTASTSRAHTFWHILEALNASTLKLVQGVSAQIMLARVSSISSSHLCRCTSIQHGDFPSSHEKAGICLSVKLVF